MSELKYFNRHTNRIESEKIYGEGAMRWLYTSKVGKKFFSGMVTKPIVSRLYGAYQDTSLSAAKVDRFVRDFSIKMDEYEDRPFRSFNDFFTRRFRPGMRPFNKDSGTMPAFAEARYLGFEAISKDQTYPVKGEFLTALALTDDLELAKQFYGGPMLIARLCPVDYHRFHYPDDGSTIKSYSVHGPLHSVNPVALNAKSDIFATNERVVTILDTKNFGKLAYIEVGAIMVGKIVQTHDLSQRFNRGDEKGYFLFGGSTVIVLGEAGRWKPQEDILKNSSAKMETFVKLGSSIAHRLEK